MTETYGQRIFRAQTAEVERREAMAATFDAASQSALSPLGPMSGWRCLDAGSGNGSMARWLADEAGEAGRVLALDVDTAALEAAPYPRVDVLNADITDPALELATFDLVHARFLLMNLRSRDEVLDRLAAAVRPGGYLVISDAAGLGNLHAPLEPLHRATTALWTMAAEAIGTDVDFGLRHHAPFVAAGLTDVRHEVFWPIVSPGSPMSRVVELSLRSTADMLVEQGAIDRRTIDASIEHLRTPGTSDVSFAMVSTVGRRPA